MDVLLLTTPYSKNTLRPSPPIGLAYLAAVAKSEGHHVTSLMMDDYINTNEKLSQCIIDAGPDILGMSVTTPAVNNAEKILSRVKKAKPDMAVVAGGAHPTIFPEEMIKIGVDLVVRGEGESTFHDILACIENNGELNSMDGITYQAGEKMVHNPDRELIKDLDSINFPAWEYFPIHHFESYFKKARLSLPVLSSRGCPGKCVFCYKGIFGRRFRVRQPENILDEIQYLYSQFKIEEFSIIDDCFTAIPKRAEKFCELYRQSGLQLPWTLPAGIRVDTLSGKLLTQFKASGCYRVGVGIETGNAEVMKTIKKGVTLEQVENAACLLKKCGMEFTGNFMIGNLGENIATVNDTIRFAQKIDPDYAQFTRAVPFPGSAMYRILKAQGRIVSQSWDDYDYFDANTVIFKHEHLTHADIKAKLKEAYRRFYFRPKVMIREAIKRLKKNEIRKTIKSIPFLFKRLFN